MKLMKTLLKYVLFSDLNAQTTFVKITIDKLNFIAIRGFIFYRAFFSKLVPTYEMRGRENMDVLES